MSTKNKFIAIEGGEGSGKSSLLEAVKATFGSEIITTREPGGSPYAEIIRSAAIKNPLAATAPAETTLCLMFAARFDNTINLIRPALTSGKTVISDRFDASSYAYNVIAQANGNLEKTFWDLRGHLSVLPDLYVFIDVDPSEGLRRASNRNNKATGGQKQYDHFDDRKIDFHKQVRAGYLQFLKKVPHIIIDANRPLAEVQRDFIEQIKKAIS